MGIKKMKAVILVILAATAMGPQPKLKATAHASQISWHVSPQSRLSSLTSKQSPVETPLTSLPSLLTERPYSLPSRPQHLPVESLSQQCSAYNASRTSKTSPATDTNSSKTLPLS